MSQQAARRGQDLLEAEKRSLAEVTSQDSALFQLLGNGPANPAADALVPEDLKRYNPVDPDNYAQQIPLDMDWYEENYSAALDAYLAVISA